MLLDHALAQASFNIIYPLTFIYYLSFIQLLHKWLHTLSMMLKVKYNYDKKISLTVNFIFSMASGNVFELGGGSWVVE